MPREFYDLLGVPRTASSEDIRRAYLIRTRVVHPDRFNRAQQAAEWFQANDMLRELNLAYEILSDPAKRARYDASVDQTESGPRDRAHKAEERTHPESEPSHSAPRGNAQDPNRGAAGSGQANPGFGQAKSNARGGTASTTRGDTDDALDDGRSGIHRNWNDLPEAVRQRLVARQAEETTSDHWRFSTHRQAGSWPVLVGFCLWLGWLWARASRVHGWLESSYAWTVPVTTLGAFLAVRSGGYLLRWHRSHLKPFFYTTRLYFIRADLDDLWFWRFTELRNFRMDELKEGDSILRFEFAGRTQRVKLPSSKAMQFDADFKRWQRENEEAFKKNDHDYVVAHDDFLALRASGPIRSTPPRAANRMRLVGELASGIFAALVLVAGIDRVNRLKPLTAAANPRTIEAAQKASPPSQAVLPNGFYPDASPTPQKVLSDQEFLALPLEERRAIMSQSDRDFISLSKAEQDDILKLQTTEYRSKSAIPGPLNEAPLGTRRPLETRTSSRPLAIDYDALAKQAGATPEALLAQSPKAIDPCRDSPTANEQHRPRNGDEFDSEH